MSQSARLPAPSASPTRKRIKRLQPHILILSQSGPAPPLHTSCGSTFSMCSTSTFSRSSARACRAARAAASAQGKAAEGGRGRYLGSRRGAGLVFGQEDALGSAAGRAGGGLGARGGDGGARPGAPLQPVTGPHGGSGGRGARRREQRLRAHLGRRPSASPPSAAARRR